MRSAIFALALGAAALLAACAAGEPRAQSAPVAAVAYDPARVPTGAQGQLVREGHDLIVNTRARAGSLVGARMDCQACHLIAGTRPRGGTFVGVAAQFPQWNKRAHRFIALQDRLAECFLYSMNGHPPAYNSRTMLAMVAYITYLSRGTPIGATPDPRVRLASISLGTPKVSRGAQLYAQRCAVCHGAGGNGSANVPPLWGASSFNSGAGMHRVRTMAGFVRYNMPANAPGSLTDREAYDVAAFVLTHPRPKFRATRQVTFPAQPASYF